MAYVSKSPPPPGDINNSYNHKRTRLDRTVRVLLDDPDRTPSRAAGIDAHTEKVHRWHGTSVILESCLGLSLGPSTYATACTLFHRFYHSVSLTEHDVWSAAMASTLLATKVEDEPKSLKQIVEEYARIYARRLRRHICATVLPQHLNKFGPVYKEWHQRITAMESIVLRTLGFTFYWISDSHPHRFLLNFCRALELNDAKFMQRAWNYCNDSCRLDLSVRYLPEVIASSAILLAARDFNMSLPVEPRPWWKVFIGNEAHKGQELVDVANAILGTCRLHSGTTTTTTTTTMEQSTPGDRTNRDPETLRVDWLAASRGFLPSLIGRNDRDGTEKKGFNDPDSFLWFCQSETFEKELQKSNSNSNI
eukprot:jgi/Psemu1/258030/estExt_Genewise1Plus.C_2580028